METVWGAHWGIQYNTSLKRNFHLDRLRILMRRGQLGPVILDVGSGLRGLGVRAIEDVAYGNGDPFEVFALDIAAVPLNELIFQSARDFRIRRCEGSLEIPEGGHVLAEVHYLRGKAEELRERADIPTTVDTIIISDLFNYVDFEVLLRDMLAKLRVGGRLLIFNKANLGLKSQFHPNRPRSNAELLKKIAQISGVTIESVVDATLQDECDVIAIIGDITDRAANVCQAFRMFGDAAIKTVQSFVQDEPTTMIVLLKQDS